MNKILNNELFEAFANASGNTFVYVTDVKEGITRWSQQAVDFFGLEAEYLQDSAEAWLEHVHPDDRELYIDDINAVLSGVKKHHNCQYRASTRYGDYVWVECRGSMIYDEDNEATIFAGIMTRLDNQNKYDTLTHLLTGFELLRVPIDTEGTLMFLGIDKFRSINTQYGILYGNKVIVRLAEILQECVDVESVYRFQGDVFLVFAKNVTAQRMKDIFNEARRKCLSSEFESNLINFSISAGIVEFKQGEEMNDILAKAELCLVFAKDRTATNYEVYSDEIEIKSNRRNLVSEALLRSIKNDFEGFYLVYQPILANSGDTVVGCEALLRWKPNNEQIGACYPDEFISILESNGGIMNVGYYVMRESIRQASIWQQKYKKFNVSFNVSYLQLEDPNFVDSIIETVEQYKADPSYVIVELTESVMAVDTMMIKNSFAKLKAKGIKIALDDFGTGNSSFWSLHNIDIDVVKLDQSFIRGLDSSGRDIDYAIVESVGLMCKRIGCSTVAEGVETEDIWKMISVFEFYGLQGYLFSRPVEVPVFEETLVKYNMLLEDNA